jgi:hypothetical protein
MIHHERAHQNDSGLTILGQQPIMRLGVGSKNKDFTNSRRPSISFFLNQCQVRKISFYNKKIKLIKREISKTITTYKNILNN